MKELTKRELNVLEILWEIKKGFVNDVIANMQNPKPPYTTVSSIIRILETKGYVAHKAYGNTHEYWPVISKLKYKKFALKSLITNYFEGSLENVVSFMVKENELSEDEVNELSQLIGKLNKKGNE
jgi:BlaI family penicillinase repressor